MDEGDLADAFRTGSAEGVRAVYERYSGAVFTIARRAAIDLYRRRAHGPEPVEPKDDATITLPPSMECIWEAWQIRIALDMLPAEEREVVRAQHFAGLTHAQIAQQLAMPIGTVKSRSHRAHRRLASMLGHLAEVAA